MSAVLNLCKARNGISYVGLFLGFDPLKDVGFFFRSLYKRHLGFCAVAEDHGSVAACEMHQDFICEWSERRLVENFFWFFFRVWKITVVHSSQSLCSLF